MTTDRNKRIKSIGNFLSTYNSDLNYIRQFQNFKSDRLTTADYLKKSTGTFYQFLIEFRVMRNVKKEKVGELLTETKTWIAGSAAINVDKFARHLCDRGLTHEKIMTSLSSKILFLNDPWTIFPFDNLAKKSLGQRTNIYSDYIPRMEKFKKENLDFAIETFESMKTYLNDIESSYKNDLRDLETIRLNRFIDKLLWTGVKSED
jgi:hypothetical protein